MTTRDDEATLAYNFQVQALEAQRGELATLQTRGKDFVGLLTLAGSFIGAFGKEQVGGILAELSAGPNWLRLLFVALPLLAFGLSLWVMVPRGEWAFGVSGIEVRANMEARTAGSGFSSPERMYLAYVGVVHRLWEGNARRLRYRMWAIWAVAASLAGVVVLVTTMLVY